MINTCLYGRVFFNTHYSMANSDATRGDISVGAASTLALVGVLDRPTNIIGLSVVVFYATQVCGLSMMLDDSNNNNNGRLSSSEDRPGGGRDFPKAVIPSWFTLDLVSLFRIIVSSHYRYLISCLFTLDRQFPIYHFESNGASLLQRSQTV